MQLDQLRSKLRFEIECLTCDPWGESSLAHFKYRNDAIREMFPSLLSSLNNRPVGVDLASGTGTLANHLREFFITYTCIDADKGSIQLLKKKYKQMDCICCELPTLPELRGIDVATMFGSIFYLTDNQIRELCKNLASGLLKPRGIFIVNNLSEDRLNIIEASGFKMIHKKSFPLPKHRLARVSAIVRQFEIFKAVVLHQNDKAVISFLKISNRRAWRKVAESRFPFRRTILKICNLLLFPMRCIAQSVCFYKMLLIFGSEQSEVFVFKMSYNCD